MQNDTSLTTVRGPWGIPVHISPSILMLFLVFVSLSGGDATTFSDTLTLFAILMASIFAHEMGHAWAARKLGVKVSRITLHGGGGSCQHNCAGALAAEFIVIMGPIVNLGLWALLSVCAEAIWSSVPERDLVSAGGLADHRTKLEIAYWLWVASNLNLALFFFNLVPVQPLDGGKLLHLWLLRILRQDHALIVVGGIGLIWCVLWIPAMIFMFFAFGFVLLFLPDVRAHLDMLRGGRRLNRLYRQ